MIADGTKFGRYEIRSQLGAGGMGEVYLAHDAELSRPVALKFLHAEVAADQKRVQRFIQEAKAASALNHPNIITVYDTGQTPDGVRYFATEFVDGVTLREHSAGRALKLNEALEIAIQIVSALVAAHAAGIVHREIKPENVMIRRDGYVKVLDFGLAKLTEQRLSPVVDKEAATRALINIDPGAVIGTVSYMSPEQASGREVDARTDIWSLGVVLYEMLTGHLPFGGPTASHSIVSILETEPPPLARYLPEAPESLAWIVTEALTKDREERCQTAKEFLGKLRRLKQRLETGAEVERSTAPELMSSTVIMPGASESAAAMAASVTRDTARSSDRPATIAPTVIDRLRLKRDLLFRSLTRRQTTRHRARQRKQRRDLDRQLRIKSNGIKFVALST